MAIFFPTYRQLANAKAFYKILSEQQFEELKIIGRKYTFSIYTAHQLPERVFIQDILASGVEITKTKYDSTIEECLRNLIKMNF